MKRFFYKANTKFGQGMVEYALILSVVVVLAITLTTNDISSRILEVGRNVVDVIGQVSNM